MIQTVHTSNTQAIKAISSLYGNIECDVTYNKGGFWKNVGYYPTYKFDLNPQFNRIVCADVQRLPVKDELFVSTMFDPPFLVDTKTGVMNKRFSSLQTMNDLYDMYTNALKELYRVTVDNGYVVFKCQDTVHSQRQWWVHVHVMSQAERAGFYVRDIFVLHRKNAMKSSTWKTQQHARRNHCYFIVLQKGLKIEAKTMATVENKQLSLFESVS